jgi:FAD/FMN-containing dehydrogenase
MEISSQHGDGLGESVEQLLADGSAQGLVEDATIASSLDQAKAFWHMRHVLPEVQKPEGGSIKADVSVPVASVPQFLEEASAAAKAIIPGCRPVPFGHLGDGNVHFNVSQPIGADTAQFLARWGEVNDAVNKIVLKYNGSISAEHGIGKLKRDSLPKVKDPVALELMRGLKRMLDPNGILNPGKVL